MGLGGGESARGRALLVCVGGGKVRANMWISDRLLFS